MARMSDGTDFLMRPVVRGLCKYSELKDGTLDLFDVAAMNEALDVMDENTKRERDNGN